MRTLSEDENLDCLDLSAPFLADTHSERLFRINSKGELSDYEVHFSVTGHEVAGRFLADQLSLNMANEEVEKRMLSNSVDV